MYDDNYLEHKKIFISLFDLRLAKRSAQHILKRNLFRALWDEVKKIFTEQQAFYISMVTSYCRPFTRTDEPGYPKGKLATLQKHNYTSEEKKLHEKFMDARDKIFAHSDGARQIIKPLDGTFIYSGHHYRLEKVNNQKERENIEKLIVMIDKLLVHYVPKCSQLQKLLTGPKEEKIAPNDVIGQV